MCPKKTESLENYQVKENEEVMKLFKKALKGKKVNHYIKTARILAKPAIKGEKIETIIDGIKETENIARDGDYLVQNPAGERYLVARDIFSKKYKRCIRITDNFYEKDLAKDNIIEESIPEGFKLYNSRGKVWAFEYHGVAFKFMASWGEFQIVNDGDFLVSLRKGDLSDIYRIEKKIFHETYKIIDKA